MSTTATAAAVPLYIEMRELAKLTGWPTRKVRRALTAAGALFQLEGRKRWVTTIERLEAHFPEVVNKIQAERAAPGEP